MTYIEINGVSYPIHFGMASLAAFTEYKGITLVNLTDLATAMNLQDSVVLIRLALLQGARRSGTTFVLSWEELADAFEDDFDAYTRAMELYADSVQKFIEDTDKKKAAKPAPEAATPADPTQLKN